METLLNLGIDWQSILFYLINFGILYVIVAYFAFPKVNGYLENRQQIIKNSLDEANQLKESFQAKLDQINSESEQAKKDLAMEMESLKASLEQERAEMISEIEAKRAKMLEDTNNEIQEKQALLIKESEQKVLKLIQTIVLTIARNKIPEDVVKASVNEAWEQYTKN